MTWKGQDAHFLYPHTLAQVASNGYWKPYRHLVYLSKIIGPKLAKGGARLIIQTPPRIGKSVFITEWTVLWFLQNFARRNVMIAAYNADLASDFGRKIRDHLQYNNSLRIRLNPTSTAADRFKTTTGADVFANGVGGAFTGRGAHLFVVDDPFKDWKEASSEVKRRDVINWWQSVADTRLEPNASVIIVNTRWHQGDLAGHLQSEGGWETIDMPALCEDPVSDVLGRKLGEALCPERYDEVYYQKKKKRTADMIWNALYQQRPTPPGGTIIQREWLKFYDDPPPRFDQIIQSWDCTFKETNKSDFVVGQVWGSYNGLMYLLYQMRDRMGFAKTIEAIKFVSKMFPDAYNILIEEKANGAAVIETLSKEFMGIVPVNPRDSKASRLNAVAPIYQQGKIWYPNHEAAPWIPVHIEELVNFGGAPNDDTVDAATQAIDYLAEKSGDRIEGLTLW